VLRTGESVCAKDHPFPRDRRGYPDETYVDVSYDPIRMADGTVRGVLCIVIESTARVVGERRLRALADLDTRLAGPADEVELARRAAEVLGEHPRDVPFALLFLPPDRPGDGPAPAAWCGAAPGGSAGRTRGHLRRVLADGGVRTAPTGDFVADPPAGSADRALVLPVAAGARTVGALVAGVSRHHVVDQDHRAFLERVAAQISRAVGRLRAEHRVAATLRGGRLDLRLPANAKRLTLLRRRLEHFLAAHGVSEHDSFDLLVAVSEAAANAIEHPLRPTEFSVRVTVEIDGHDVVAEVRDSGRWRPPTESLVRGRGLGLIAALMDLDVRQDGHGTVLTMRRRLQHRLSAFRHPPSAPCGGDSLGE
jgi:anti-sigma regulatory factor (Ser/Thr protein kinase)